MYYLHSFDGVRLPQRMTVEPIDTGMAPETILERVGGAVDVGGSDVRRARVRQIRHKGVYIDESGGSTAEQQLLALLAKWGRRGQLQRRRKSDDAQQWINARLLRVSSYPDVEAWKSQRLEVDAEFILQGAHWREAAAQSYSWAVGGGQAVSESGEPVGDAVLTITATTALTGIDISTDNSTDLTYSGTVNAGQSLVLDAGALTVRNNGGGDYGSLTYNANHAVAGFWVIDGSVTFTVTATTGTGTVYLSYYRQYV